MSLTTTIKTIQDPEGITGDGLLEFVNNELFPTFKTLAAANRGHAERALVAQRVFEDAYNHMKNGTLLRQVVNKLNEVGTRSNRVSNPIS